MKAEDAAKVIERAKLGGREWDLVISVFNPGTIGGSPCVPVERMQCGFDWDNGKLMIYPAQELTALTPDDVAAIHRSAKDGQSWHAYQQDKRWREKCDGLQAKIDALMLEYCPNEMTPQQIKEWERHQKAVPRVSKQTPNGTGQMK